jgi:hypothetical protein
VVRRGEGEWGGGRGGGGGVSGGSVRGAAAVGCVRSAVNPTSSTDAACSCRKPAQEAR